MSKYLTFTDVIFTNKALLLAALADLGYRDVEQGEGLSLYGYQGDVRKERAEIVVRRGFISSASNDLGFTRNGEGFTPIISEYDQRTLHDGKFVARLRVAYNERVVGEMQRRLRGSLRRETQGSTVKLKLRY